MVTYDDASTAYDSPAVLYDGDAAPSVLVEIGGLRYEGFLQEHSLQVRTPNDGSQATCDLTLVMPTTIPAVDDPIKVVGGEPAAGLRLYTGYVRSVVVDEFMRGDEDGTYVYVRVSAQDDGEQVWLPVAAPFDISDHPDYVDSFPYRALNVTDDRVDGVTVRRRGTLVIQRAGLEPGQNVLVTSGNQGLVAEEFTVQQVSISWPMWDLPEWSLDIGAPLIRLAQVVRDIPDGSITETKISDGAISTPKLAADAVIANVANVGGTVVIDSAGIAITNGDLTVTNPEGTAIIDGTSDMFKIVKTGILSLSGAGVNTVTETLTELGTYTEVPAFLSFVNRQGTSERFPVVSWAEQSVSPGQLDFIPRSIFRAYLDGSNFLVVEFTRADDADSHECRYYILKEAGI